MTANRATRLSKSVVVDTIFNPLPVHTHDTRDYCVGLALNKMTVVQPGQASIVTDMAPNTIGIREPDETFFTEHEIDDGYIAVRFDAGSASENMKKWGRVLGKVDPVAANLIKAAATDQHGDQLLTDYILLAIERRISSWFIETKDGASVGRIKRAIELISDNLSRKLSLDELAAAACLSSYHFCREFRRETGRTPHQFVAERRVQKAQQLLEDTGLQLSVIADMCGFSSQSHMTSAFVRITGVTPGKYRKSVTC